MSFPVPKPRVPLNKRLDTGYCQSKMDVLFEVDAPSSGSNTTDIELNIMPTLQCAPRMTMDDSKETCADAACSLKQKDLEENLTHHIEMFPGPTTADAHQNLPHESGRVGLSQLIQEESYDDKENPTFVAEKRIEKMKSYLNDSFVLSNTVDISKNDLYSLAREVSPCNENFGKDFENPTNHQEAQKSSLSISLVQHSPHSSFRGASPQMMKEGPSNEETFTSLLESQGEGSNRQSTTVRLKEPCNDALTNLQGAQMISAVIARDTLQHWLHSLFLGFSSQLINVNLTETDIFDFAFGKLGLSNKIKMPNASPLQSCATGENYCTNDEFGPLPDMHIDALIKWQHAHCKCKTLVDENYCSEEECELWAPFGTPINCGLNKDGVSPAESDDSGICKDMINPHNTPRLIVRNCKTKCREKGKSSSSLSKKKFPRWTRRQRRMNIKRNLAVRGYEQRKLLAPCLLASQFTSTCAAYEKWLCFMSHFQVSTHSGTELSCGNEKRELLTHLQSPSALSKLGRPENGVTNGRQLATLPAFSVLRIKIRLNVLVLLINYDCIPGCGLLSTRWCVYQPYNICLFFPPFMTVFWRLWKNKSKFMF